MPKKATSPLTDAFVKSLKPKVERYDIFDANLAGFGIRVSPQGTKSWVVLSRNMQRKIRVTLGRYPQMSLGAARQRALLTLSEMAEGNIKEVNLLNFSQMQWPNGIQETSLPIKAL